MPAAPPAGTPMGLEMFALDVARGSKFYKEVFGWVFAPSTWGLPQDKLLIFTVPGGIMPIGGIMRRVEPTEHGNGTKLFFYVNDMAQAQEAIEKDGGKMKGEVIPEEDTGLFQYFEDSEGNQNAIYTYNK